VVEVVVVVPIMVVVVVVVLVVIGKSAVWPDKNVFPWFTPPKNENILLIFYKL
jgi:hypothetical protein